MGSLLSHLFAPWYGPVSLVVPFFYSATLLSNMFLFGVVLGTEFFSKTMRVGTYVILTAVILLPVVGPDIQQHQDIVHLFHKWYAIGWFTLLLCATAVTGTLLVTSSGGNGSGSGGALEQFSTQTRFWILLVARAASISVNLTVSRSFILSPSHVMWICFLILKVASGAVYTYAIIVQGTAVDQARFVPLNTTTIILVNAATGVFIWEDWRVIQSWHGYACVFVLLGLGCDLLLTVPLLHEDNPTFGTGRRALLLMHPKRGYYHAIPDSRLLVDNHHHHQDNNNYWDNDQHHDDYIVDDTDEDELCTSTHSVHTMSRRDAWKNIIMPPRERTSTI